MSDRVGFVVVALVSATATLGVLAVWFRRSVRSLRAVTHRLTAGPVPDISGAAGLMRAVPHAGGLREAIRPMVTAFADQHQQLRVSDERFRQIAETITEVFWIADVNLQTMTYVSPAYEQIWGRSCDSLYRDPRSFLDAIHPDDVQRVIADLRVKQHGEPFDHEYRIRRPDGTERWIWDRGYPVSTGGRPVSQYVGVAQDITDRVRREHGHRETEERTRFALQAAHVGVWDADLHTGMSFWSDTCEVMHGVAPGTFGKTFEAFLDRIVPEDRDAVRQEIAWAVREHRQARFEYRSIWPDGTRHWILSTARFFYDDGGRPMRGAGVSVDISAHRALEDQFRHAQRVQALGQFTGSIAHDFHNVLAAILGNADVMLQALPTGDARRADVAEIAHMAVRGANLTRHLIAFSRREPVAFRWLRIGEVVTGLAPMLRRLLDGTIELRLSVNECGLIRADVTQLEQILMNLAINARDAMPTGGVLTFETADLDLVEAVDPPVPPGAYVRLSVRDTGCGMEAAVQRRMFEPFFSTKLADGGLGLGLAAVSGIVHQYRGHIGVQSEVGCGTTVDVFLPRTRSGNRRGGS